MNKYDSDTLLKVWQYAIGRFERSTRIMAKARWREAVRQAKEQFHIMNTPIITEWEDAA